MIVMNAGTATSKLFQFISAKFAAINTPTTTKAGVVTALVTTAINGLRITLIGNNNLLRY